MANECIITSISSQPSQHNFDPQQEVVRSLVDQLISSQIEVIVGTPLLFLLQD